MGTSIQIWNEYVADTCTTTINLRAGFCTEEEPWDYPNITAYNYIALKSITSKM